MWYLWICLDRTSHDHAPKIWGPHCFLHNSVVSNPYPLLCLWTKLKQTCMMEIVITICQKGGWVSTAIMRNMRPLGSALAAVCREPPPGISTWLLWEGGLAHVDGLSESERVSPRHGAWRRINPSGRAYGVMPCRPVGPMSFDHNH